MAQIKLTENELKQIIQESIVRVLNESATDEGLKDTLSAAWNGAKQGFRAQKAFDRGTKGFKQQHDQDDFNYEMSHPLRKAENTAQEQATALYQQYKQYQAQANKLLSQYNAMVKQYGLVKQGVGKVAAPAQAPLGGGVGNPNTPTSISGSRKAPKNNKSLGLWGA